MSPEYKLFGRAHITEMEKGIGLASAIQLGAPDDFKAHMQIKADGLCVLLVHIQRDRAKFAERILKQALPSPLPARIRVDEKHFHFMLSHPDKSGHLALIIPHAGKLRKLGDALLDQGAEELDIRLAHKMVGGANGGLPNIHGAGKILLVHREYSGLKDHELLNLRFLLPGHIGD
jgi:hypothetical protein